MKNCHILEKTFKSVIAQKSIKPFPNTIYISPIAPCKQRAPRSDIFEETFINSFPEIFHRALVFFSTPTFSLDLRISLKSPPNNHGKLHPAFRCLMSFQVNSFFAPSRWPYRLVNLQTEFFSLITESIWFWVYSQTVKQLAKLSILFNLAEISLPHLVSDKKRICGRLTFTRSDKAWNALGFPNPWVFQHKILIDHSRANRQWGFSLSIGILVSWPFFPFPF